MGFERVAIIGADVISASIGLAFKAHPEPPEIVGYDRDPHKAELARSQGAFDRVQRALERAGEDADLVLVAVALPLLRDALSTIGPNLRPGCLVTDTARLKTPVMAWAEELLPQNVQFVGGHLILNPLRVPEPITSLADASADLVRGALYCFTLPVRTTETLVGTLGALAEALDAQPFFIDPTEHDGMQAGVEDLPSLLTIALLLATVDTPGWQEMRKFAAHRFASATAPVVEAYEECSTIHDNRANVLLRLNGLLAQLIQLREILTRGDNEALEAAFAKAVQARAGWIEQRNQGLWGAERIVPMDDVPTAGDQMARLIFGDRVIQRLKGKPGTTRRS